jgi:hypothetical protein
VLKYGKYTICTWVSAGKPTVTAYDTVDEPDGDGDEDPCNSGSCSGAGTNT